MYNRYIPQPDGTYRRNRMQDPGRRPGNPPCQNPPPPPPPRPPAPPVPPPCREPQAPPKPPLGFLRQLLPKDFDIEDLLVVLLLLLMAGEEDSGNALLTLALYFFL
ncbi:MAG TPA: hypothetical protein DFH97_04340 [Clostridiales bacterium]|nr:hypothetical protein [Clostridiales bacterium]